jgi:calcium permeable stress-gated cation channel
MSDFGVEIEEKCSKYNPADPKNGQKDIYVQLVISLALGVSAFFGFCVSTPEAPETTLY